MRVFAIYRPFLLFLWPGVALGTVGLLAGMRYLYFVAIGEGGGHIQSVVFAALCLILSALMVMMGFLAELIATNRKLMERIDVRVQRIEHALQNKHWPSITSSAEST